MSCWPTATTLSNPACRVFHFGKDGLMGPDDHSKPHDKELGMGCPISRRDFLNGVAIGVGGAVAGSLVPGLRWAAEAATPLSQDTPGYDPPALTGMRGSHPGSFEVAHS